MRYLILTYYRKPSGQIDEAMVVSKNLKTRDHQMCNVIMDYAQKKVMKCVIEGKVVDTDWDNLYAYYKGVYPNIVDRLSEENGWRGEILPSDSDDQVTDIDPKYVQ